MTGFEQAARAAGVDMPDSIVSSDGNIIGEITDLGAFKVYSWEDVRLRPPSAHFAVWLGRTIKKLHALDYEGGELGWASDWFGLRRSEYWEKCSRLARAKSLPWHADLEAVMSSVRSITARVKDSWYARGDYVVSHGDLESYNVLPTADRLLLIDWESVGWESAYLELGRALYSFFPTNPIMARVALAAYVDSGGKAVTVDDSFAYRLVARKLGNLVELIDAELNDGPRTGWMRKTTVAEVLAQLLTLADDTTAWAKRVAALSLKAHSTDAVDETR